MNDQPLEPIRPLPSAQDAQTSTQILAKPTRRSFSQEYKLQILEEIAACQGKRGTVGRILRREGLFASQVTQWRRALEEGLSEPLKEPRRGRKPDPAVALRNENSKLASENLRLKKRLHQAETLLELQKKVASLFQNHEDPNP